jgi:hypothetical protein
MKLTIFLDIEEVFRLCQLIPAAAPASKAMGRAIQIRQYWGSADKEVPIECDDDVGRDLLDYAESSCPNAADKIRRAFRLAHLRIDDRDHGLLKAFSLSGSGTRGNKKWTA